MVKYYYDKYNSAAIAQYEMVVGTTIKTGKGISRAQSIPYLFSSMLNATQHPAVNIGNIYTKYTILTTGEFSYNTAINPKYENEGILISFDQEGYRDLYFTYNGVQYRMSIFKEGIDNDGGMTFTATLNPITTRLATTNYSQGTLVQSNIAAEEGTYPVNGKHTDGYWYVRGAVAETTPGTVVTQPYSTAGNGGRKLVRLSNGWLVAAARQNFLEVFFYKSMDNGTTWTPLCSISQGVVNTIFDIALASNGTKVHVLIAAKTSGINYYMAMETFDATTVENKRLQNYLKLPFDSNLSALGNVSLAIDPLNGHLHAAWASKNASYSNSFNIRYAKSTDGGVTWSTPVNLTVEKQSIWDAENPSIVIVKGKPFVTCQFRFGTSGYYIRKILYTDSGWDIRDSDKSPDVIHIGGIYPQYSPSGVVDKDGVIANVWHGLDEAHTTTNYIRFSKSTNEGTTWSTMQKLVPGINGTLTVDKSNKYVITYEDAGTIKRIESTDKGATWSSAVSVGTGTNPSSLYDSALTGQFGIAPPTIYKTSSSVQYIGTYTNNSAPTLTLNTGNNATLYENDTFLIDGSAFDVDKGNIVNVKYQINGGQVKAITTEISNGTKPILFSEQLRFKSGKLFYEDTAITEALAEGVAHQLKVWSGDDQGGKSEEQIRNFYVVPNRAPAITINPIEKPTGVIDSDKFPISGACSDPDGNDVIVSYKINTSLATEIYRGKGGDWTFDVAFSSLKTGENIIIVEVMDSHNFKTSKTIKLNKAVNKTPVLNSVARYKIESPTGSAKGVILWIRKQKGLEIEAEISMTESGVQEQYVPMTRRTSAPINEKIVEDDFRFAAEEQKENIVVKLHLSRESVEINGSITLISGVLT